MTTENVENNPIKSTETETPTELSMEDRAREMGWKPAEEYSGDKNKWVNAEVYVARAPLFEELDKQRKTVKKLTEQMAALTTYQTQIREDQTKKVIAELKQAKKLALDNADSEAVIEIDERLQEVREQITSQRQEARETSAEIRQEFRDFVKENSWYESDSTLKREADILGTAIWQKSISSGYTPDLSDVYQEVATKIRKLYPEKFENQNKRTAPSVESGSTRSTGTSKKKAFGVEDLNEDERKVFNTLFKRGSPPPGITADEYLTEIQKMRG